MELEFKRDGEFTAVDSSGEKYVIQKTTEYRVAEELDGDTKRIAVGQELCTDDGRPVNRDEQGVYRIFNRDGSVVTVTSDAPNAP